MGHAHAGCRGWPLLTPSPLTPPPRRGIIRVRNLGAWAVATYSVVWGLIVAAGLAGDAWLMWRGQWDWRHPGRVASSAAGKPGSNAQERMLPPAEGSAEETAGSSLDGNGGPAQAV